MKALKLSIAMAGGALAFLSAETAGAAALPPGATVTATPSSEAVQFSVYLPLQNKTVLDALVADQQDPKSTSYHKWLTPDQFNAQFGPSSTSVANVTQALQAQGLRVSGLSGRAVQVVGTAAAVANAFSTSLSTVAVGGRTNLIASAPMQLPSALKAERVTVAAFSGLPRMRAKLSPPLVASYNPSNRYSPSGGYWYDDLKEAYDYPSFQSLSGAGVNVAIVISSDVLDSDIAAMFKHENFTATTGLNPPAHSLVNIDGGAPFSATSDGSFEASLDVQQVLGGAPGANVTVVDIPDLSDDHVMDAYNYIVNAKNAAKSAFYHIVNSSFGACELFYTASYNEGQDETSILAAENAIFEQGSAEGISFVASSGDSGGLECPDTNYVATAVNGVAPTAPSRFIAGVEFPASSPFVTAVGGTNLITTMGAGSLDSAYVSENGDGDPELPYDPYGLGANVYGGFWGAGGGISAFFAQPQYQAAVNTGTTYRTTPDVGMQVGGCPGGIALSPCGPNRSYVLIYLGGKIYGVIGTSVSSPEFVGALALYVQKSGGGVGNVNPFLYSQGALQTAGAGAFYNRNIAGYDGKYSNSIPSSNYNYITGNGTPKVRSLFGMTGLPPAGSPQSASNP